VVNKAGFATEYVHVSTLMSKIGSSLPLTALDSSARMLWTSLTVSGS
jgi:hypothetical protein